MIYDAGRSFGWSGPISATISDNHIFAVETFGDNQTKFIQSDSMTGADAVLIGSGAFGIVGSLYVSFNKALKARVEGQM